jgi:hypothetical protein
MAARAATINDPYIRVSHPAVRCCISAGPQPASRVEQRIREAGDSQRTKSGDIVAITVAIGNRRAPMRGRPRIRASGLW